MTPILRTSVLVAAAFAVASCSWFGGDDDELEPTKLVDIETKVKVKRLWTTTVGGDAEFLRVALQPASDGSRIYAASRDGNVLALSPDTGKSVWRTELEMDLSAGPGIGEDLVVVAAADGYLIALDADTGEEMWRANVAGESLARPLVDDGTVVALTIDNRLRAISAFDGSERWTVEQSIPALTMRGSAAPVLVGTTVIAGFDNGRLVAVNMSDGDTVWETMIAPPTGRSDLDRLSDVDGQISVVGQDIYASGYQGAIAAIASESGQMLWAREVSSFEGVSADWNNLYTVDEEGVVIALTRRTGDESWRQTSLIRREPTVPAAYQTTVVVGDLEGYLHFFSNFDGDPVARVRAARSAVSIAPVVVGNRLLVQGDDGKVSAYAIEQPELPGNMPAISDEES
ncbi:MAG: outer membrane protein assembly factor BamB [Woeseiaceae bacterium]|nr:outer membrane protein assembly factor BamB [Woeseiaceae bacterium]NIP21977.1 outer membrane protein assembly factor BamB [Woeseiaceae bacterium]NIS91101.1 outer membrane protein assembly factor BamB [Woeseiaceae bacterium]